MESVMSRTYFLFFIALWSVIYLNGEVRAVSDCGGLIEETNGTITSPSYPDAYPLKITCTWEIKAPKNHRIALHFKDFDVGCNYDSVSIRIKMKDGRFREQVKLCGSQEVPNIISDSNVLLIEFKSDNSEEHTGFKMEFFTVSECGGLIEEPNGVIKSPLYPLQYPPNQTCTWEIKMPPNNVINLNFKQFDLEDHESCGYDYLTITSKKENREVRQYRKFCGSDVPAHITSDSNFITIVFTSDNTNQKKGFELDFSSVSFECGGFIERSKGVITSPLYPSLYPPDMNCTWIIQAPLNQNIKLNFISINMEHSECAHDSVTIQSKMENGEIVEHGKFCGTDLPSTIFSESNVMLIQFVSNDELQYQGFKTEYSFEQCGGLYIKTKGNISTPFFPEFYPPNKMCQWTVLVPSHHQLKMRFLHFQIEGGGSECPHDSLLIQSRTADGMIRDFGKYCGDSVPSSISSNDTLLLTFISDRRFQGKGFKAEYFIDKNTDYNQSTSLMKSNKTADMPNIETILNDVNKMTNKFSDGNVSTVSSVMTSTTSAHELLSENQHEESLRKDVNNLSASTQFTSKNAFLKEGGKNSSSSIERQLLNDCGKYIFFLRRMLESEP